MSGKRKMYTAECKREAVSLITNHGYGVSDAARNLGLHANMLSKWKRNVEAQGEQAFPGNVKWLYSTGHFDTREPSELRRSSPWANSR